MDTTRDISSVRLDKWLWAARFFKTRPLATEAIVGGKVYLNGARAKPGRAVVVGDQLTVRRGPFVFELVVRGLASRRGPASHAVSLYEESVESRENRARISEELQVHRAHRVEQGGRPNKRDRRRIIRFLRRPH
jgi:ribosome-associated heat shock protein Hsp15